MTKRQVIDLLGGRKDNFDWRSTQPELDLTKVETVCVLHHNDKTGDAILISLLVDALVKARPGLAIYVGCPSSFVAYWSQHPAVVETVAFDIRRGPFAVRAYQAWRSGRPWRGRFDVVVSFHPFARPEQFALIRSLRPRVAIGFNKDPYRLFDYSLEEHRHGVDLSMIADRTRSVMRLFGHEIDVNELQAHLPSRPADRFRVGEILGEEAWNSPRLLVNTYGAGREKRLSPKSTRRVVQEVRACGHQGPIYVSVPGAAEREYEAVLEAEGVRVIGPHDDLSVLCAFVAAMDLVISPDTSVGHIAAALRKPQICLFGRRGSVPVIWRPLNDCCAVLVPPSGESVNDIDWDEFGLAVRRILPHGMARASARTAGGAG